MQIAVMKKFAVASDCVALEKQFGSQTGCCGLLQNAVFNLVLGFTDFYATLVGRLVGQGVSVDFEV